MRCSGRSLIASAIAIVLVMVYLTRLLNCRSASNIRRRSASPARWRSAPKRAPSIGAGLRTTRVPPAVLLPAPLRWWPAYFTSTTADALSEQTVRLRRPPRQAQLRLRCDDDGVVALLVDEDRAVAVEESGSMRNAHVDAGALLSSPNTNLANASSPDTADHGDGRTHARRRDRLVRAPRRRPPCETKCRESSRRASAGAACAKDEIDVDDAADDDDHRSGCCGPSPFLGIHNSGNGGGPGRGWSLFQPDQSLDDELHEGRRIDFRRHFELPTVVGLSQPKQSVGDLRHQRSRARRDEGLINKDSASGS